MSRHDIVNAAPQRTAETRQSNVPLNAANLKKYRDMQGGTGRAGLMMAGLFCAFSVIGIWGALTGDFSQTMGVQLAVLSLGLTVFIALAALPALLVAKSLTKTLKGNLPALVVSDQGVQDNASNYVFGFIPWSEIETVTRGSRYARNINKTFTGVSIVMKNKELLLNKKQPILRMWLEMDDEIKKKHWVFIPQGRIEMPVEEVVKLANQIKERVSQ